MAKVGSGFGAGWAAVDGRGWIADSPMGIVRVSFTPANTHGVLDHVVELPSGERVYNPLRVVPAGENESRCEVVFTVRQRAGMTDEQFDADVAAVEADLERLRALLER